MTEKKKAETIPFMLITNEWIDRWLSVLNGTELKVYLKLAYHYNHEKRLSFPGQKLIGKGIGVESRKPVINALNKLEDLGLVETIKKSPKMGKKGWPSNQYRMLHVDGNGYHRAERQQLSLKEAIAEYKDFLKFYSYVFRKYNSQDEILQEVFKKYPEYKKFYYSRGFDKEEDFIAWGEVPIYFVSSLKDKYYDDLKPFLKQVEHDVSRQVWDAENKRRGALKEDMRAQWERVMEDYKYCDSYVVKNYPEHIQILKEGMELKAKGVKDWDKKVKKEMLEEHPDIKEIEMYYNYGVFKDLSKKHGFATREIGNLVKEMVLDEGGGLEYEFDGYVYKVHLPNFKVYLTEEEKRLVSLEVEDEVYKDEDTGETHVLSRGFTREEKRNFKETLEKIKAAKIKAIDALVGDTTNVLANVYLEGEVREIEGGKYKPDIWYWKDLGDGSYSHEIERGYHPGEMGLEDLLIHVTHEINHQTQTMREDEDIKDEGVRIDRESGKLQIIGEPREDALVPIPPVTLEQVKARFEKEKEKVLTEKAEEETTEKATG